ncbi:hypothetical protein BJ165DRAFT_1429602 [Panaeolus papilionaceus]|nr:hypothetical protein BJ165DRAFT_1429602 [Panaeolus papilionaceus]
MSKSADVDAPTNKHHPVTSYASPPYRAELKDFDYELKKGGTPWATLTLTADSEISKNFPTFIESTPITGRVTLDLAKPDSITGVEINITGRIFIPQVNIQIDRSDEFFLKVTKKLWSKEDGTPPRAGDASSASDGKLHGYYNWGFSVTLPETVTMRGFESHPFRLPGTLSDHDLRAGVGYRVTMTIVRGKFRSNDVLADVPFVYVPIIPAPPFPFLRWECYQSGLPPTEPADDPEGWEALKPVIVKGTAFQNRGVTIKCSLYAAKPLVYVRGSFVPLFLELESDDSQLLEVITKPDAISLILCRYMKDRNEPDGTHGNWTDRITWHMDDIEQAAWWVRPGQQAEGSNKASLHGELHLGADFPPSLVVGRLAIEYSLCFFPIEVPGFKPDVVKKSEVLLEQPINIVTAFADHVRPVSQAPPGTKLRHTPAGRIFNALRF